MKTKIFILIIIAAIVNCSHAFAQATIAANAPVAGTEYLGWNNASNKILDIKNEANKSIKFYTNAGNATFNNQRMIIDNGNNALSGFVGIGTNFSAPSSRLHIRENSNNAAWLQLTGNNTSDAATDGLRIGILNPTGGGTFDAQILQQEDSPLTIWQGDNSAGTPPMFERMRFYCA